jgi:hypothetical protein
MRGLSLWLGCVLLSCAPARTSGLAAPSQAEWTEARARLFRLRAELPTHPYVEIVKLAMREPRTGRILVARGAVAVDPHRAMRMVLLGPGGGTALDVWTTPEHWRFAVPALDLLRRGDAANDSALPIGFFRWWFLAPLRGRLLTARTKPDTSLFVLRDAGATVTILDGTFDQGHVVLATRREGSGVDRLAWSGRSLAPGPGDRALYEQPRTGLGVEVAIESMSDAPPEPDAFVDPDAKERRP